MTEGGAGGRESGEWGRVGKNGARKELFEVADLLSLHKTAITSQV